MTTTTLKAALGLAALSTALAAPPARADDASQPDRQKVAAQVRQTLKSEGRMSDKDVAAMGADIDRHAGDHGYGDAVSDTVHAMQAQGCYGTCLAAAIHKVNGAMDNGHPAAEAAKMASQGHAGPKGTAGERSRGGADAQHRRDRMHDRDQDRAGAHAGGMHGERR